MHSILFELTQKKKKKKSENECLSRLAFIFDSNLFSQESESDYGRKKVNEGKENSWSVSRNVCSTFGQFADERVE